MKREVRDLAASVRARLLNRARETKEEFDRILVHYGIERLLYRLSRSSGAANFLLKGAMLFTVWQIEDRRPTRDLDLLGFGSGDPEELTRIFRAICQVDVVPDGITFDPDSVHAGYIREQTAYGGVRVKLVGDIARARVPLQIDVGIGDVVIPGPEEIEYPTMLDDFPAPKLRAYPVYTVAAEKLESIVRLGIANTRMKDFYDLWVFAERLTLDDSTLAAAIKGTFERRAAALPSDIPIAFSAEFSDDAIKQRQWDAFLKKNRLGSQKHLPLATVTRTIWSRFGHLMPHP
ncbi:MAG: nucleotidyl transferase AbiEii/AbiGii toxin family protein [Candidatus Dadabacteria bacterium]|nr:MAG: nucleotidyl transferase AbiEii/AbiGii toxin family protein [Candidatus Dadabacteria bacterium]